MKRLFASAGLFAHLSQMLKFERTQVLPLIIEICKLARSKLGSSWRGNDPFSGRMELWTFQKLTSWEVLVYWHGLLEILHMFSSCYYCYKNRTLNVSPDTGKEYFHYLLLCLILKDCSPDYQTQLRRRTSGFWAHAVQKKAWLKVWCESTDVWTPACSAVTQQPMWVDYRSLGWGQV